jgi:hypothetical protein
MANPPKFDTRGGAWHLEFADPRSASITCQVMAGMTLLVYRRQP